MCSIKHHLFIYGKMLMLFFYWCKPGACRPDPVPPWMSQHEWHFVFHQGCHEQPQPQLPGAGSTSWKKTTSWVCRSSTAHGWLVTTTPGSWSWGCLRHPRWNGNGTFVPRMIFSAAAISDLETAGVAQEAGMVLR